MEAVTTAAAALKKQVRAPDPQSVKDHIVGEDWRYVAVPDRIEAWVERKVADEKKVLDIFADDRQERYILSRLESEDVRVDKDRYEDRVNKQENRQQECLHE